MCAQKWSKKHAFVSQVYKSKLDNTGKPHQKSLKVFHFVKQVCNMLEEQLLDGFLLCPVLISFSELHNIKESPLESNCYWKLDELLGSKLIETLPHHVVCVRLLSKQ